VVIVAEGHKLPNYTRIAQISIFIAVRSVLGEGIILKRCCGIAGWLRDVDVSIHRCPQCFGGRDLGAKGIDVFKLDRHCR